MVGVEGTCWIQRVEYPPRGDPARRPEKAIDDLIAQEQHDPTPVFSQMRHRMKSLSAAMKELLDAVTPNDLAGQARQLAHKEA